MQHHESINTRLIPVEALERSDLNARRTGRNDGLGELKASILAHGLMQNLVVTAAGNNRFRVIAGGRRLEALRSLQAEGKLPQDHAVFCNVVDDKRALEMSLAENAVRVAMHPADEFEAFAALIAKGQSAADVAARFGVEETLVLKRMKLGRVAPELLAAYRDEQLTLDCLMAYAVTDDHARQLAVFQSLQGWQKANPRHIRACLTETMASADSPLARFVGLDAYEQAGGATHSDLFGDDTYLENPELLHSLAADKLNQVKESLAAEGWGWIEVNPERDWEFVSRCGLIHPAPTQVPQELLDLKDKTERELEEINNALEDTESDELIDALDEAEVRFAEIEERIADYVAYDAGQMKLAGCYISLDGDGELSIEKGLVKPEHRKQLADSPDDIDAAQSPAAKKKTMPETLRRDLEAYRLQVAQLEIAMHPAIAFDLLVFHAACGIIDHVPTRDGVDVHFRQSYPRPSVEGDTLALKRLEAMHLSLEWLKQDGEAARFREFSELSQQEKLAILAYCTAVTLKPKLASGDEESTAYDIALTLTGCDVADYWRPTQGNYLSRITRDQLLAVGREVLGEQWALSRAKDKKSELAGALDRAFADPERHGHSPERIAQLKSWLPAGFGFVSHAATVDSAKAA